MCSYRCARTFESSYILCLSLSRESLLSSGFTTKILRTFLISCALYARRFHIIIFYHSNIVYWRISSVYASSILLSLPLSPIRIFSSAVLRHPNYRVFTLSPSWQRKIMSVGVTAALSILRINQIPQKCVELWTSMWTPHVASLYAATLHVFPWYMLKSRCSVPTLNTFQLHPKYVFL
jgi:hypothetical protein